MKKIINQPDRVVAESLDGFVHAYQNCYVKHPAVNGVIFRGRRKNKTALVIGGGSGHEPMFAGFVGQGLADAAACGNVFASPDPNTIYQTALAVNEGQGVLFVYGCYAGDNLNFDMAEEFLNDKGIPTAHVRVQDDVASAPKERYEDRRGIAGDVFVVKIAGAACDTGASLEEVTRITEKARNNTFSLGIATAPAQLPGVDKPIFELPEGEIEYGMGLHGERGVLRTAWEDADTMTDRMVDQLLDDSGLGKDDQVCVLINSLGATTITELSIVYRQVARRLAEAGIRIYDADLNNYCTSQEMGGFSITLFRLDEELKKYYDMPCYCPYYAKGVWTNTRGDETEEVLYLEPEFDDNDTADLKISRSQTGVLSVLTAEDARNMLLYVADKVIAAKNQLTEIDSAIGDGDHGIGMAGGMQKVRRRLQGMKGEENAYEVFAAAGRAMLLSMGGASGVIFGSLFLAGGQGQKPKTTLDPSDLAAMEAKSLEAIQQRGGAAVGDKTMVDALAPAVSAMKSALPDGSLLDVLSAAEKAAEEGMEATKGYIARFGRAKSLGQRALGYQDAGATSVWLILRSMREFVEGTVED